MAPASIAFMGTLSAPTVRLNIGANNPDRAMELNCLPTANIYPVQEQSKGKSVNRDAVDSGILSIRLKPNDNGKMDVNWYISVVTPGDWEATVINNQKVNTIIVEMTLTIDQGTTSLDYKYKTTTQR
jgi:hypothetical protein